MNRSSKTKGLENLKKQGMDSLFPGRIKIMVGAASCGLAAGAGPVFEAIKKGVKEKKIKAQIKKTGCIGLCHLEPLVDIIVPGKPRLTY